MNTIPSPSVPVCAVLSLTDWHKSIRLYMYKVKHYYTKVLIYIMKTVLFRKQIELTVTIGQLPAELVKPEPATPSSQQPHLLSENY